MTRVTVTRRPNGTYRISIGNIIWYDNLEKSQVFDAMESTSAELGRDNIEHMFEFK